MPEEMDLNWLRGTGLQPGESELPQDDDGGEEDKGICFCNNICYLYKDLLNG